MVDRVAGSGITKPILLVPIFGLWAMVHASTIPPRWLGFNLLLRFGLVYRLILLADRYCRGYGNIQHVVFATLMAFPLLLTDKEFGSSLLKLSDAN